LHIDTEYLVEMSLRDEPYDESLIVELLAETPLHILLAAADEVKRRLVGNIASYVVNVYIAYTNVCIARCPLCNFYARNEKEAYVLPPDAVAKTIVEYRQKHGITEVHITGGLNPELRLDYYISLLHAIRDAAPGVIIKAFTAEEIDFISRLEGEKPSTILAELREAGLDALPGGGAEILDAEVRRIIAPYKSDPTKYLKIHETAHRLGIRSNATMLYGHVEEPKHIARHLLEIYKLQGKTGGFISFIPLRWNPGNTPLANNPRYKQLIYSKASGIYDLRVIAVSRLVLAPRIKHIVAYWVALGKKLASLALRAGADDMGGTFYNEPVISSARGTKRSRGMDPEEIEFLILQSGFRPQERDTFYNYLGSRTSIETWRKTPWVIERFT